jgi:hypothetical protein
MRYILIQEKENSYSRRYLKRKKSFSEESFHIKITEYSNDRFDYQRIKSKIGRKKELSIQEK